MTKGYVAFVLHAHLPFVHHPEHESFFEEKWFFEAMTETYIPLIAMFDELEKRGIRWRLTMSVTPPLAEMMVTHSLQDRYNAHIGKLLDLAGREMDGKRGTPFEKAAEKNLRDMESVRRVFNDSWGRNVIAAFRHHVETGSLEVITCAATHAFLPFIRERGALKAQVKVGVDNYMKHFGRPPKGMWIPECAYSEEIEAALADAGIEYFFLDAHGLLFGEPSPMMGMYRPVRTRHGLAAFGRDIESSKSVWSAREGYPGDAAYREFYRDLGYDAPYEEVKEFFKPDGSRRDIGLKYHRITGEVALHEKGPYDPAAASRCAWEHAGNFLFNRKHQIQHLHGVYRNAPVVVSPYDAELFGHWWYEGPQFLKAVFEQAGDFAGDFLLETASGCINEAAPLETVQPAASSWGDKGYFGVWLNGANDWIYRHLHVAEKRMTDLARRFTDPDAREMRALNQAARELMLAEASDWPFIMTNQSTVPYSHNRIKNHLSNFNHLFEQLESGTLDEGFLSGLEWRNPIFQEIDYTVFREET